MPFAFSRGLAASLALAPLLATQDAADWAGTWFTSRGVVVLEVDGDGLGGRFRDTDGSSVTGEPKGRELSVTWRSGDDAGAATWKLDKSRSWFEGAWSSGGRDVGTWRGWREDPAAAKGRRAKWAGAWRTSWGIVDFGQDADAVDGVLGAQGWYRARGDAAGRRLDLRYTSPLGNGVLWLEQRDADRAFGAAERGGAMYPFVAQRLDGFDPSPKPKPGKVVSGLAGNRMAYHLFVPKGWKKSDRTPLIVFLHGSNMSSRPYVETLSATADLGSRFAIVGIEGERWVDTSSPDDPRHNYTYVNYMGRSTYEGYPNTDRESPALVAEVIRELVPDLGASRVFVGGHSQGAFLSYFFLTHEPDLVDGIFPIAGGLVIQCEPDVFEGDALRAAQRATPLAVVHGRNDGAVPFSQGLSSFRSFQEHGFPALRLFDNDAPHAFVALRFVEAIDWLDAMSSDDPDGLVEFAERRLEEDGFRDASAALLRARSLPRAPTRQIGALSARVDEYAEADAERFLAAIEENADGAWVDDFLEFRDRFEFAEVARPAMDAYAALRAEHEPRARELISEARQAFQRGDQAGGWRRYQQIVDECYASSWYRRVKGWIADR